MLLLAGFASPQVAAAERTTTREALERLQEFLDMQLGDGELAKSDLLPAMVVSTRPRFEESESWYQAAALATLVRALGADGLRYCEACMEPRLFVEEGRIEQNIGPNSVAEILRLDEATRGSAAPAQCAIWLDETAQGVALRAIDLRNSRVVVALNIDPMMSEQGRSQRSHTLVRELDRRARGDALTHAFVDLTLYPGQHVSLDWTEQWGDTNANLSGVTLSIYDPVVGIGGAYYRALPYAWDLLIGAKIIMSVPTAIVEGISGQSADILDPLLTGVLVVRLPIASSNYGISFTASTNGRVGLGVSLLNISLLPVLP